MAAKKTVMAARRSALLRALGAYCGVALALSACGSSGAQSSSGSTSSVPSSASGSSADAASATRAASLTVAIGGAPQSLDPSKDDNGDGLLAAELLYAPLIQETYAGTYVPGLASSWKYVGTGNTKFELTIRSGLEFSDGEPVTAKAVAAALAYNAKGSGPAGSALQGLTVSTPSADTVELTVATPVANFPETLAAQPLVGLIECPKSLANPSSLESAPCGAGPYTLDTSATVSGSTYTFVPNPHYFAPSQIHYSKVVLSVISDPTAQLNALRTGQVQMIAPADTTLGQIAPAQAAGLQVDVLGYTGFVPIWLMDREGALDKPLGNVLVRQALNDAINRSAIASAVYGSYGAPDDEPAAQGWNGYDPALANYYTYDPAKAKQLLDQAGYPHGFSMNVLYITSQAVAQQVLQALVQEFNAIGVSLTLVPESGFPPFSAAQVTKKYTSFTLTWGASDITSYANLLWVSHSGANAFYATPSSFLDLYNAAQKAPTADQTSAFKAMDDYLVKQAWSIPIIQSKGFIVAAKGLGGLPPAGNVMPGGFNLLAVYGS